MRSVRYARTVREELFRGTAVGLLATAGLVLGPQPLPSAGRQFRSPEPRELTFEGRGFGEIGPYEKIIGRATIAVDPNDPRNAKTVDLDRAIALETPSGLRSGRGYLSLRPMAIRIAWPQVVMLPKSRRC